MNFDAIARERATANEHGEVKRLVNSLLPAHGPF